jgi:hypothetical protein
MNELTTVNMAEFSKEFCEKHDPETPWDFSIQEIGENLPAEQYHAIICEGYGFLGIYRKPSGEISLVFDDGEAPGGDGTLIELIAFEDLDRLYEAGELPWQKRGE